MFAGHSIMATDQPNQKVKALEDQAISVNSTPPKADTVRPPARPAYGSQAALDRKDLVVLANYYKIDLDLMPNAKLEIRHYEVDLKPAVTGRKQVDIFRSILHQAIPRDKAGSVWSDLKQNIYVRGNIANFPTEKLLPYLKQRQTAVTQRTKYYHFVLNKSSTLDASALIGHLRSPRLSSMAQGETTIVQALNNLFVYAARLDRNKSLLGSNRSFVHETNEHENAFGSYNARVNLNSITRNQYFGDLGLGVTAIRGFSTSVRPATGRILINVNFTHGLFYKAGTLESFIPRAFGATDSGLTPENLKELHLLLKGIRVRVIPNNRQRVIAGLATKLDGAGEPKKPRISDDHVGPGQIEFFKKAANIPRDEEIAESTPGSYISVAAHFNQSKAFSPPSWRR